jgi:hypothetical protein
VANPLIAFGNARLLRWSAIDDRHRPTGGCRQIVADEVQGPAAGLAVFGDDETGGFFLVGCDRQWNTVTDTWHRTLDEALRQAEFEYEGVSATWTAV